MKKKILLLVNSSSGTGSARQNTYRIIEELSCRGCEVTVYPILPGRGMTAETILAGREGEFDRIACVGGDGTLNHVVSGLMAMNNRPCLGYLPSGSTNDFANSLHVPSDVTTGCAAIAGDHTFAYDVGRFNDRYFNYVAAFGAFTAVSYSTRQEFKNVLGHAAYVLKGILSLSENISYRCRMKVIHDGQEVEDEYLYGAVSNTTMVGGFSTPGHSKVRLNDGLFEVLLVKAPERPRDIEQILPALASGNPDSPYVRLFQTRSVSFHSYQPTSWTLDGEFGGAPEQADITVLPGAVRIFLPEEETAKNS